MKVHPRSWAGLLVLAAWLVPAPAEAQDQASVVTAELDRTIGNLNSGVDFYRLGGGALRHDTLWVSEPGRLFAVVDGRIARSIGSGGDGPGEFQGISSFGFVGGRLWVSDDLADRLTLFDSSDDVDHTVPYRDVVVPAGYRVNVVVPLPDGGVGIRGGWESETLQSGPIPEPVLRGAPSRLDTLVMAESHPHDMGMSGGMMFTQPVSDRHRIAWDSRTGRAAFVEQRQGDHPPGGFTVAFFDPSGAPGPEIADSFSPEPLTDRHVERFLESYSRMSIITDEVLERIREALFIPEYIPPVARAQFDSDGRLWIRQQSAAEGGMIRWRVYEPDLGGKFDVLLPHGELVLDASGRTVWTRGVGEVDVAVVRKWSFPRPG